MPTNLPSTTSGLQPNTAEEPSKARVTLQGFLNVMDRFRNTIQVTGVSARVGQTLSQTNSLNHSVQNEMRNLFYQTVIIEFIYGGLGMLVLSGILLFGYCSGRVEREGWSNVVRDLIGGNNFLHFIAQQIALITGMVGLISIYNDDGRNDLIFAVPILITLSNLLVGASNTKQSQIPDVPQSSISTGNENHAPDGDIPIVNTSNQRPHLQMAPSSPRLFHHADNHAPDNTMQQTQHRPSASPTAAEFSS